MITFVAPMFNEHESAKMFVGALQAQTKENWECIIYHNGPNPRKVELLKLLDGRFKYIESISNTGSWGAYNRIEALPHVTTSHVIQTSIQDYWVPTAVQEISKFEKSDFIYWNSINHLFGYHAVLDSEPMVGRMDWGNFAIKTDIAREVNIKYPKDFRADGLFIKDCMQSGLIITPTKIGKILTIHN